jgi:hypothetical protein
LYIVIDVLGMVGGLFSSIGGIATVVIGILTRGSFISFIMSNLYVARNIEHLTNETLSKPRFDTIVAAHSQDNYRTLRKKTRKKIFCKKKT